MTIRSIFGVDKPIMGMLHLKGESRNEILARMLRETDVYTENGVDAVIVENYFGNMNDVEASLVLLEKERPMVVRGVNVLDDYFTSYRFAQQYGGTFMQVDSAAGHLVPDDDKKYGEMIKPLRESSNLFVLGGVRFKYQPYLSGRSLETDLMIAKERCDAIVVTGEKTGMPTSLEKVKEFRDILNEFPIIIGAGMTPENCFDQLKISDGAIVGSTFKLDGITSNEVDPERVKRLMEKVFLIRARKN